MIVREYQKIMVSYLIFQFISQNNKNVENVFDFADFEEIFAKFVD